MKANYTTGEITMACEQASRNASASFEAIAQTPKKDRSIDNTLLKFEETMVDYYDATAPLSLMRYVHPGREIAQKNNLPFLHPPTSQCRPASGMTMH